MLTRDERKQVLLNHVVAANAVFNKVAAFENLIQQEPHNALYYEEVQQVQKNQHIYVAIKLVHILEKDDNFRKAAGLPRLDLPEHLWGVRDMRSTHTREQDFLAITVEVEVLCQQRTQPSSNDEQTSHGQATPRVPVHQCNYSIPPTPYINQTAMDQHKRVQPAPLPPRMNLSMIDAQTLKQVQSPQLPDSVQPQRLPFIDAPPAPAKNHQSANTSSPSTLETTSKSLNRRGVKQSSSVSSSASMSMGNSGPVCWNFQEVGHHRHNCKNPSYCSKCKQSGHLPVKCPLKGRKTEKQQTHQKGQPTQVDPMFSDNRNRCIHCGGDHMSDSCPMKIHLNATQDTAGYQMYNDGAMTGKANTNNLPFSSKNGRQTAANMTPSSSKNSVGVQRRPSSTREQRTPQVSPNTSHQNGTKTFHQCTPQILSHHHVISQFHSSHHILHLLMRLMQIQLLHQTFQLHSA